MNSASEDFFISVRKYTSPMVRVWIRVALIKISSRGLLVYCAWVLSTLSHSSGLRAGVNDWLFAKSCWKVREKIPCSRLQYCEIYGLGVAAQLVTQRLGQHACRTNLEYGERDESFATHHAYAFAILRILAEDISFTSNPS
jgi:hypothetical protein